MNIDEEIERLRLYMDAFIEVRFTRPEQAYCFPSFDRFTFTKESRRIGERKIFTASDGSLVIAERTHLSIYGVPFDVSPWVISGPHERDLFPKKIPPPDGIDIVHKALAEMRAERITNALTK